MPIILLLFFCFHHNSYGIRLINIFVFAILEGCSSTHFIGVYNRMNDCEVCLHIKEGNKGGPREMVKRISRELKFFFLAELFFFL